MATCPNGHQNPDGQRFCGECGARVLTASEERPIGKAVTQLAADIDSTAGAEPIDHVVGLDIAPPSPSPPSEARPSPKPELAPLSSWPPNAQPYYRPSLMAAIAASVGVIVGCIGPWMSVMLFTLNGLDAGNYGVTGLTLGAVSCLALLTVLFWPRTPFNPRWALPVAWAPAVAGVACLSFALGMLIRIMTIPKANIFGVPVGAAAGWGLWLLAFSSAVLCAAASIVATQIAHYVEGLPGRRGQPQTSWTNRWRWAAITASAIIVISAVAYFWTHWENESGDSNTSPTELPSFPSLHSFPTFSTTPEPTSTTRRPTPAKAGGPAVGSRCLSREVNSTATSSAGTTVRCLADDQQGYTWKLDTGTTQDPWISDQIAWSACHDAGYSDAQCRAILDGTVAPTQTTGPAQLPGSATAAVDPQSASLDQLRAIANGDLPFVISSLTDRWVAQISSKRPGLKAEGIVWDNVQILHEHLQLRQQYPGARLLWSDDWSTFSKQPDFWVTVAGIGFPDQSSAQAWCTDHKLDRDHCFPTLIRR